MNHEMKHTQCVTDILFFEMLSAFGHQLVKLVFTEKSKKKTKKRKKERNHGVLMNENL